MRYKFDNLKFKIPCDYHNLGKPLRLCLFFWKNSERMLEHSFSSTPVTTLLRWFSLGSFKRLKREWHAPALGSMQPYITQGIRDWTIAPAHMGQGSRVTYKMQFSRRHDCKNCAAWVIAIISACAVGSLSSSRWLCALAMMPSLAETIRAPTGTSSSCSARRASSSAISMCIMWN